MVGNGMLKRTFEQFGGKGDPVSRSNYSFWLRDRIGLCWPMHTGYGHGVL